MEEMIYSMLNCSKEEFAEKYKAMKEAEAEFEKVYEPFKRNLLDAYKTREDMPKNIHICGVNLTYVAPSFRDTIDSKKLKEEEPELAKKFTKSTTVSATFRLDVKQ